MSFRWRVRFVALIAAIALSGVSKVDGSGLPDRAGQVPDLMQAAPETHFPDGGLTYCGPVAVSNSIMWLAKNGYPRLAQSETGAVITQSEVARKLAQCMHTTATVGTSPTALMSGLERYVLKSGYEIESLSYQGWETHPKRFDGGRTLPDLRWIETGMADRSAAWLMIGWYKFDARTKSYSPRGQHWVTLVGAEPDADGGEVLFIHDSAPRSGKNATTERVKVEKSMKGSFSRYSARKNKSMAGWYKLSGDLKFKDGADCAILDGAVVLRLE